VVHNRCSPMYMHTLHTLHTHTNTHIHVQTQMGTNVFTVKVYNVEILSLQKLETPGPTDSHHHVPVPMC
jgi:hypothetical protein